MKKFDRRKPVKNEGYTINEYIRASVINVIDTAGNLHESINTKEALELAREQGLDLVQVGERDGHVVAKIMDFGKFLYDRKKKMVKAKKTQKVIQIKEVKMRPKIGPGDYETKMKLAIKFLKEGKRVKFSLQFRGRQPVSVREVGSKLFERIKSDIESQELGPIVEEKETRGGPVWSKIFYIKE